MEAVMEKTKPVTFVFEDDGLVPNNPLPFIIYKRVIDVDTAYPERTIEDVFASHHWGSMWRNGIYDYLHYHSTAHEVLGVARGQARVRFGGDRGKVLEVTAGDVAILPPAPAINACSGRAISLLSAPIRSGRRWRSPARHRTIMRRR